MMIFSRLYTYFFLGLAIVATNILEYDSGSLLVWLILPFVALSLLYQLKDPLARIPLEDNELKTDILSLLVVLVFTAMENHLVHSFFHKVSNDNPGLFGLAVLPVKLKDLPLWLECVVAFFIYDFLFYVTHRLAHTKGFLWKLHSVHHSANKMTYLNSYRIHPLDLIWRRHGALVVLLLLGISLKAFVLVGAVLSLIGPITHLNINLKHGFFNYLFGTNEVHIWHHSVIEKEAGNYGITMIWDHLFGTYYYPRDRRVPDRMGLADAEGYPVHDYWKQLAMPWRWK